MGLNSIAQYLKRSIYDALIGANSPSSSNVFATKADIGNKTVASTVIPVPHTGDTDETYLVGLLIPANTYTSTDEIPIHLLANANSNNGTKSIRGYINTTNSLVTGSPVLIMTTATNNLNYDIRRLFFVQSSTNIIGLALQTQSLTIDTGANNAGNANITLPNFNQDLYFIVSVQLTSALDNFTLRAASIKRERV
jgi:hypothetical protein